jgi:hypothetical protein
MFSPTPIVRNPKVCGLRAGVPHANKGHGLRTETGPPIVGVNLVPTAPVPEFLVRVAPVVIPATVLPRVGAIVPRGRGRVVQVLLVLTVIVLRIAGAMVLVTVLRAKAIKETIMDRAPRGPQALAGHLVPMVTDRRGRGIKETIMVLVPVVLAAQGAQATVLAPVVPVMVLAPVAPVMVLVPAAPVMVLALVVPATVLVPADLVQQLLPSI